MRRRTGEGQERNVLSLLWDGDRHVGGLMEVCKDVGKIRKVYFEKLEEC